MALTEARSTSSYAFAAMPSNGTLTSPTTKGPAMWPQKRAIRALHADRIDNTGRGAQVHPDVRSASELGTTDACDRTAARPEPRFGR
jgi:hypothetical protein